MANIASLLATTPDAVEKALCYRVVGNKLGSVEKMHTVDQAVYGRDAFAKAIYERLFTWIVGRINAQLEVKVVTPGDNSVIGVLDIYGFEIFENNRYVLIIHVMYSGSRETCSVIFELCTCSKFTKFCRLCNFASCYSNC